MTRLFCQENPDALTLDTTVLLTRPDAVQLGAAQARQGL